MKEIMNFALFFTIFISLSVHARPNNGIILRDRHRQKWGKKMSGEYSLHFSTKEQKLFWIEGKKSSVSKNGSE